MYIVVALKSNVEHDEEGQMLYDEEGSPALKDEEDVGILVKTHPLQAVHEGQIGVIFRAEVFWNIRRNPSPALVDPNELVWLSVDENPNDDEVDEENQDEENNGEQLVGDETFEN